MSTSKNQNIDPYLAPQPVADIQQGRTQPKPRVTCNMKTAGHHITIVHTSYDASTFMEDIHISFNYRTLSSE